MLIDQSILSPLLAQVGVGGVGGFALGVFLRRITSIVIAVMSFLFVTVLVLLGGLRKLGLQLITPESTERFFMGAINATFDALLSACAKALPLGGSFSLGLCLGLLMGKPQSWL